MLYTIFPHIEFPSIFGVFLAHESQPPTQSAPLPISHGKRGCRTKVSLRSSSRILLFGLSTNHRVVGLWAVFTRETQARCARPSPATLPPHGRRWLRPPFSVLLSPLCNTFLTLRVSCHVYRAVAASPGFSLACALRTCQRSPTLLPQS